MAQILNADPETNPRLRQIYEILLLAGYFRIRISSLRPFDKVLGGLAWAITCSNFEIDVEYNDEMQIGQKIKVSEKVCDALKKMRCPYTIQPFQIQGLDLNSIYPVVQWLIKFVYETREYRQKFNTILSNFLGEKVLKLKEARNQVGEIDITAKRLTKNSYIKQTSRRDPLRVYSTLIEFGDVTSTAAYNKLCAIVTGKVPNPETRQQQTKKDPAKEAHLKEQHTALDDKKNEFSLASYLFEVKGATGGKVNEEEEKIIERVHHEEKNNFKKLERRMSFSGAELEKLVVENRERIEVALKKSEDEEQSPELQLTKILAAENQAFESQKQYFSQKLAALQRAHEAALRKLEVVQEKAREIRETHEQHKTKLEQIEQIKQEVEQQLKSKTKQLSDLKASQLQKNVQARLKLKAEKAELKKTFKAKVQQLKKQKLRAQQNIPEVDEQVFNKMVAETKVKKRIYDEKFLEMTLINQELAVLQRKAENFTSPTQIAQYQQRFLQLIESINKQIQTKKDLYSICSHLQSLKQIVNNYVQVMYTFKQNYVNSKSKDDKKEFIDNLKEVYKTMENNLRNSETVLKKITQGRSSNYEQYIKQVKMERQFYMVLKELKNEVEAAQYEAANREP